jgi:hypothetical protein
MKFIFYILYLILALNTHAQRELLNPVFFYQSTNPAFAVSINSFDRASMAYSPDNKGSFYINKNINSIYGAFGLGADYSQSNGAMVSGLAAYHTYVTKNNYHLMMGVQPKVYFAAGDQSFGVKSGILLTSSLPGKWLIGMTYIHNDPAPGSNYGLKANGFGLQFGKALFPITRMVTTSCSAFIRYFPARLGLSSGESYEALGYFNAAARRVNAGLGAYYSNSANPLVLTRLIYFWKINIGATFGWNLRTKYPTEVGNTFEISIQRKI